MSFSRTQQKENVQLLQVDQESPFDAFMSSPVKAVKGTPIKSVQTGHRAVSKGRLPLSPITASRAQSPTSMRNLSVQINQGSSDVVDSVRPWMGEVWLSQSTPSLSLAGNLSTCAGSTPTSQSSLSKNTSNTLGAPSQGEDIFSAWLSSPHHRATPPSSAKKKSPVKFDLSSPVPSRASVCFEALSFLKESNGSMVIEQQEVAKRLEWTAAVKPKSLKNARLLFPSAPSSTPSLHIDLIDKYGKPVTTIDPVMASVMAVQEVHVTSPGGKIADAPGVSRTPSFSPKESRRKLKNRILSNGKMKKHQQVESTQAASQVSFAAVNAQLIPSKPTVAADLSFLDTEEEPTIEINNINDTERKKGSPSRLSRGGRSIRTTPSSRQCRAAVVSIPNSSFAPSSFMKASLSSTNEFSSNIHQTPSKATTSSLKPVTLKETGNSPVSPMDPLTPRRKRAHTMDEAQLFGSQAGLIGGRMYDAYGFEENPTRAVVNPTAAMSATSSQMDFWMSWLDSQSTNSNNSGDSQVNTILFVDTSKDAGSGMQGHQKNAILTSMVLSGIPHALRGRVWPALLYVPQYRAQHSPVRGYYGQLRQKDRHTKWGHQIELDLHRTFCGHLHFRTEARGQRQLSNILNAYSHYNEKVGYCQGMSFLVGVLLMVMEEEEKAFWTFAAMMDNESSRLSSYFEPGMAGVLTDVDIFRRMLLMESPQLYAHFEKHGVDCSFFCARWFLQLFTDLSDWTAVLRIWDLYFLKGHTTILRASMGILKASLNDLLAMKNAEQLFPYLLNMPFAKLHPSVLLPIVRSIDIDYLYAEVTAPGAEEKYKVSHIHQTLPSNKKRSSRNLSKSTIASKHVDSKSMTRSSSKSKLASQKINAKVEVPKPAPRPVEQVHASTPIPRKSRPHSMMVFSQPSHPGSPHDPAAAREYRGYSQVSEWDEDESGAATPSSSKKSFFGRMWDKLKSPVVLPLKGLKSATTTPAKISESGKSVDVKSLSTPVSKPFFSTSGVSRSEPVASSSHASSHAPTSSSTVFTSPSRKASKTKLSSPLRKSVSKRIVAASVLASTQALDSLSHKSGGKRKRSEEEEAEAPAAVNKNGNPVGAAPSPKRRKVISWMAADEEEEVKWDGTDDLLMDGDERCFYCVCYCDPDQNGQW